LIKENPASASGFRVAQFQGNLGRHRGSLEELNVGVAPVTCAFFAERDAGTIGYCFLNSDLAKGDKVHGAVCPNSGLSFAA
jgi:hypothetical protein